MKKIVGIAGSLRKKSFNKAILQEVAEKSYEGLEIEIVSIDAIPLFNGDLEEGGDPGPVAELKSKIMQADGLLIATPEYSHGTPGVLKNVLDWAGSVANENVLDKKPVCIVGASPMAQGTISSQAQLVQTLHACGAYPMPQPEVYIGGIQDKLKDEKLVDEDTIEHLDRAMKAFSMWVDKVKRA
ncbi:NAD(P)H-dependent oxidoreductase [Paenalkalicoccus suaedae]|uniref:NAD(P)H-dependent oxidoreductase n=1 Tax=Paenalkalicoccus suaedae TaxID=2592382 RepID=A0A859FG86_9BACI|nr:NAD(P)H-dependent oxidoreductase [Paenalkalicoccus suaedae]QKS71644.1 NAD(P)H-dependent oxidoreductase [Paenalkalicoccus suaedae]